MPLGDPGVQLPNTEKLAMAAKLATPSNSLEIATRSCLKSDSSERSTDEELKTNGGP